MLQKRNSEEKIWNISAHIILIIFSLIIVLPLLWIVRTSFATDVIAYEIPPRLIFLPTLKNYILLFKENNFALKFYNSFTVAFFSSFISIPIAALGGYALARYKPGGKVSRFLIIGTQMLPPIVLILPLFAIFSMLHLLNTRIGLTLSYLAFNLPFLVWVLMGFFEGIPKELEEASLIDGASRLTSFFRIIFPIAAPGIMSAGVLSFIMCWNEFLFALVLTGAETNTIPVALA
ncbi:MAG TPA: carbohydrate ABC transporter permease, partial [Candidatus Atribacteria bacterium]|nr:carbohydrate ABC transporter permease [Candidatus Atribacteria bacterium]